MLFDMAETGAECVESVTLTPEVSTGVDGLRWQWLLLAFVVATVIIVSRRPDAVLYPQFYAEDGRVWFADAYNLGPITSLFRADGGYLQIVSRLSADVSLLFPLTVAPLILNIVGLLLQAVPAPLLLAARFSNWGRLGYRAALALVYLVMPNCREVHVTNTNCHFHLALIACLLLLAKAPRTRTGRAVDAAVLILCGLSGPFCLFLLPIAVIVLYQTRDRWLYVPMTILAGCCLVQVCAMLFLDHTGRLHPSLGASPDTLVRIVAGQIYLGTLLGSNVLAHGSALSFVIVIAVAGTCVAVWTASKNNELRLFSVFAILCLAASLASPLVGYTSGKSAWFILSGIPGLRYWFFPTLAFSWMIVSLFCGPMRSSISECVGFVLLFVMLFGVVRDWRHTPLPENKVFADYARRFGALRPGETLVIPEFPSGWTIRLVKH